MDDMSEFERVYFTQTRTEVENDKRERDVLVNIAVAVVGGGTFIVAANLRTILASELIILVAIPGLALVTCFMWIRREKLTQIADRWVVLHSLLSRRLGEDWVNLSLEERVVQGLHKRRYVDKDLALKIALSGPVYGILVGQAVSSIVASEEEWRIVVVPTVLAVDIALAWRLLHRPVLRASK
ncbi:hypothetical protein [Geodermatophilus sabuli]|uniref:hypothetical protein n=1 Tax=Geodermatophilus sabuli TaxID=1564158 RepID=UPI00117B362A|nr:hypothetical protein [Geodermatophilus sabuli]MBB3083287.1 hypothetical protein [Geodermatophilus sabuli]